MLDARRASLVKMISGFAPLIASETISIAADSISVELLVDERLEHFSDDFIVDWTLVMVGVDKPVVWWVSDSCLPS